VWDTFLFCDELDLLECRLAELDDVVYRFVLVEAPVTFQGKAKPLHYRENRDRFAPWKDKIVHVIPDLDGCRDHWAREHASRDAVKQGLSELGDDDTFLLSDVDEIPFANIIHRPEVLGTILAMRMYACAVNLLEPVIWAGSLLVVGGDSDYAIKRFRDRNSEAGQPFFRNSVGYPVIGGSHFSWLGGPEAMRAKVRAFAHPEYTEFIDAHAEDMYCHKLSPAGGNRLQEVVIDESFPRFMQERRGPASWYWPGA